MASVGRDLRQIAEQLERSHQREEIRQKAREVVTLAQIDLD